MFSHLFSDFSLFTSKLIKDMLVKNNSNINHQNRNNNTRKIFKNHLP